MAILPTFCVARSSRTDLSMLVARALKIGNIADGGMPSTYETMDQLATRRSIDSSSAFLRPRHLCILSGRAPFSSRPSASDFGVRDS
jgi:hypothetical protein